MPKAEQQEFQRQEPPLELYYIYPQQSEIEWPPILGVFQPRSQGSWDRFRIQSTSDQDKNAYCKLSESNKTFGSGLKMC